MNVILILLLALILLIFLIRLDFFLGKKHHKKHREKLYFPVSNGQYQLFHSGSPLFHDMFQKIKDAKKEILVQFFIVKRDQLSMELIDLLEKKANEGLVVRLLVDRVGGFRIDQDLRNRFKQAGIHFAFSSRPGFPYFIYRLNQRNHRKISVIDGETAYVGGFNIGDEYVSRDAKFSNWRDYQVRLNGQVAQDLQQVFKLDWRDAAQAIETYQTKLKREPNEVQILATDGFDLEQNVLQLFSYAKEEILIGSPYFVPNESLMNGLRAAIERGVSVKIMVPMRADHLLVKEGGIPYLFTIQKAGAEVRLYDQGFFHGKILLIDQKVCDIGTANFDRRSFYTNKEINVLLYEKNFIYEAKKQYFKDFEASIPLNEQWYKQLSWYTRYIKVPLAKLFRPLL